MRSLHAIMLSLSRFALLAMMLIVGVSVIARYVFQQPIPWSDQVIGYLLCFMVMFHASELILRGSNIHIDLFQRRLRGRARFCVDLANHLLVLAVALLILYCGIESVWFIWRFGMFESGYLTLPGWIPRLCIPVGGAAMCVASLVRIRRFLAERKGESRSPGQ